MQINIKYFLQLSSIAWIKFLASNIFINNGSYLRKLNQKLSNKLEWKIISTSLILEENKIDLLFYKLRIFIYPWKGIMSISLKFSKNAKIKYERYYFFNKLKLSNEKLNNSLPIQKDKTYFIFVQ